MTCKDCIHYDVCYHIEHYGRELETDKPCEQFKSADVAEAVRCKDCAHYGGITFGNICRRWSAVYSGVKNCTNPDDYCSYGVRKEW